MPSIPLMLLLVRLELSKLRRGATIMVMIAVIVAGGSGTRLWPLSTPEKPKHLLAVNGSRSMLQDSYARAKLFADEVYIVTDKSHSDLVAEQLVGEADKEHIIIEPDRRGTASCIALALAYLKQRHGASEAVGFIHADHHITNKEGFADTVTAAAACGDAEDSIALIGIEPDYPATGFGYIKKGEKVSKDCFHVDAFEEKPDMATAEGYLKSGDYLWNLGLFAGRIDVFEAELKRYEPTLHAAFNELVKCFAKGASYTKIYKDLEEQPIEPALIEKTEKIVVVPGRFDWMDIGSYKDLHEAMPKADEHSNVMEGEVACIDTEESIVIEQTGRPVAVLGLENVAVISTENGILICHKEYSQRVKEVAKVFNGRKKQ